MKVHLGFDHLGINHSTQLELWRTALMAIGWEEAPVDKCDLTIMWGPNPEFDETRARGKPVLMIDFPYWNRGGKARGPHDYYKVSLNGQHPTKYIFTEKHGPMRYKQTCGPEIKPWRKEGGDHILIAGMGIKATEQNGYAMGEWEQRAIAKIKSQTSLPIVYRPKPRQHGINAITGTIFDNGERSIELAIEGAHCVVCHHGNPAVIALALGIPIFMKANIGVATHLASFDLENIMKPVFPDNRQQFFNNLAYWQWSVEEIKSGAVLQSYKNRGLI